MWTCPKCDARVDPSFEVCWRCGTTRRGEEDPGFVTADEAPPIEVPTDFLKLEVGKMPDLELPDPPLELVSCLLATLIEAKLVADRLLAEGVPSALEETVTTRAGGHARVLIRAGDLPRAAPVIEEFLERKRSREARGR